MTVYIDDMHQEEMGRLGRMKMSHMIADTRAELMWMARQIGMRPGWIQRKDSAHEHFDVAKGKREQAIALGAVPISLRQCAMMCRRRAVERTLGAPEDAERWYAELMDKVAREAVDNSVDSLSA